MMSEPGLCTFCYNGIVRAGTAWDYHHASCSSLAASAHRRCYFCQLLYADVQKFVIPNRNVILPVQYWFINNRRKTKKIPIKQSFPTSLYRWSVRSLGRMRESNHVLAITFRGVPQDIHEDGAEKSGNHLIPFGLPERVFYCFPEPDLLPLPSAINLGRSTNPEANDGVQIKQWMWSCGTEHKHCPKRLGVASKFVPTRLLHVGGRRPGDRIRVMDTKVNKIKGPYVTLSHCWGEKEGVRKDTLRSDSLVEFQKQGVPWEFLSKTFKQAVEVAQFLDVDYIWIDSLCIIQGDAADWEVEGSLMHKVYRNSFCNIAAADARDSTQGLFRKREPRDVFSARFQSDDPNNIFGQNTWRAFPEDMWETGLLQRPLYARGWVFQERMLAPRILHFSQRQIFWDCAAMSACESVPGGLPVALDRQSSIDRHWRGRLQEGGTNSAILMSSANDDSPEDFWRMAVENYTKLNLKFQTDKRRALWGIAKLVRDSFDEDYAAGMWSKNLVEQLAWRTADPLIAQRPQALTINPSWAWTSVNGRILVETRNESGETAYPATDHAGNPISFKADDKSARPSFTREPSETLEEDVLAMTRDLALVDERRRRSSANSMQLTQSGFPTPRHNSLAGMSSPRNNSLAGLTSSRNNSLSGFTPSRQNSQIEEEGQQQQVQDTILLERRTMSPQQIPPQEVSTPEQLTRQNSEITRHASEVSTINSLKSRDMEPDDFKKKIDIQAHIHQGVMATTTLDQSTWTISLPIDHGLQPEDLIIDAFPDVKGDSDPEAVHFVILVLYKQVEEVQVMYYMEEGEERPEPKFWYTGTGIMVSPNATKGEMCYVRTGAIHVRYLSSGAWDRLGMGGGDGNEKSEGMKFYLV